MHACNMYAHIISIKEGTGTEGLGLAVGGACLFLLLWVRVLMCTPVTPVVPYMPTGFAGCSVAVGLVVVRAS